MQVGVDSEDMSGIPEIPEDVSDMKVWGLPHLNGIPVFHRKGKRNYYGVYTIDTLDLKWPDLTDCV